MSSDMIEAYAKSYAGKTQAELQGKVEEFIPGSEERAGILLALDRLKAAAEEENRKRQADIHRANYDQTERHHQEQMALQRTQAAAGLKVAWISAVIAGLAAIAAIASAWYAKSQADSAALSARASIASTVPKPATPPPLSPSTTAAPALNGGTATSPAATPKP
jgi:hypothetical protein